MANKKSAGKKTVKKQTIKKQTIKKQPTKRKNAKKKNNGIIIIILVVIVIIVIALLFMIFKTKKITCTKTVTKDGIKQKIVVNYKLDKDTIINLNSNKVIYFDKNSSNYASAVKSALEENYKEKNMNYDIKLSKNKVEMNFRYDNKKKYILDDISITSSNDGISINVVSEDKIGEYASVDLNKKYNYDGINKIMNKADFTCK